MKILQKILWGIGIFNVILIIWQLLSVRIMENISMPESAFEVFANIVFVGITYNAYLLVPISVLAVVVTVNQ